MSTLWSFLRSPQFFPIVSIALSAAACGRWLWERNFGQSAYWLLGGAITATVTFLLGPK